MVTGSRGVHVVAPLRRGPAFETVHNFARSLAEEMVAADPRHLTLEWHRAERGERIYVDVNRINYAQHAVAPYARSPAAPGTGGDADRVGAADGPPPASRSMDGARRCRSSAQ